MNEEDPKLFPLSIRREPDSNNNRNNDQKYIEEQSESHKFIKCTRENHKGEDQCEHAFGCKEKVVDMNDEGRVAQMGIGMNSKNDT